ncbi:MAG: arginine--tRNA ligase, partial [Selenomonadaceae bacterium]|nr:arginine--tRNA ligase [Selenomonadaceae bacterium]
MQAKEKIAAAIKSAVKAAMNDGALKFFETLPEVALEVPPKKEFGDFATNFAMQTAKIFRTSPRKIAEEIKARINSDLFERIDIAGAGFMNFYLKGDVIYRELKEIYDAGKNFGHLPCKNNVTIQIEYVSANPTGLLHVGHGRGAAAGSAIVNIMRAAGYNVESEYYINDAGNQMDKLALSVNARYLQLHGQDIPFPEDGYQGADILDTTKRIIARDGDKYLALPDDERLKVLGELAYADKMLELKDDLERFGVHFDVWFSERTLHPDKIN